MCGFPEEGNPWIFWIDIYIPEEYDPSTALPEENDPVIVLLRKIIYAVSNFLLILPVPYGRKYWCRTKFSGWCVSPNFIPPTFNAGITSNTCNKNSEH